ncbi:MAG: hypothetical protein ACFNX6_11025, partial [Lautropia mirabilis]
KLIKMPLDWKKRFPDVKPLYAGLLSVSVRRWQVTGLSDGLTIFSGAGEASAGGVSASFG